jgi:hypothetical protein
VTAESSPQPNDEMDVVALRRKYAAERQKRLRPDGSALQALAGKYGHFDRDRRESFH